MPGEAMHQLGAEGTRRAKRWLDSTTRVESSWTNEDEVPATRLEFPWPHGGQKFSFDIGGILSGGKFEKNFFVAESKKYSSASDQGHHYDDWLAKCYVTRLNHAQLADHFMWITWHPFRITGWTDLLKPTSVREGLLLPRNSQRVFGTDSEMTAAKMIDDDLVRDVANRLWMIVLSEKQEDLVISASDRAVIVAQKIREGGGT